MVALEVADRGAEEHIQIVPAVFLDKQEAAVVTGQGERQQGEQVISTVDGGVEVLDAERGQLARVGGAQDPSPEPAGVLPLPVSREVHVPLVVEQVDLADQRNGVSRGVGQSQLEFLQRT